MLEHKKVKEARRLGTRLAKFFGGEGGLRKRRQPFKELGRLEKLGRAASSDRKRYTWEDPGR